MALPSPMAILIFAAKLNYAMRYPLILLIIVFGFALNAQDCKTLGQQEAEKIKENVQFLSSYELEGRLPGTRGHRLAQNYLELYFKRLELQPAFDNNYLQEFQIPDKVVIDSSRTFFRYKKEKQPLGLGFYPVEYSSNGQVEGKTEYVGYGIESTTLERDDINDEDLKGAIAVMEIGSPDGIHPHSAFKAYHDLFSRLKNLQEKGAIAVLLIDVESKVSNPATTFKSLRPTGIPIVFVENEAIAEKLNGRRSRKVSLSVQQKALTHTIANVGALVDKGMPNTVLIGAHYDHLGRGKEGSRYSGDDQPIHFGADDNASGTAALLAFADYLSQTDNEKLNRYNYLLVAFTAEEMGLLGSKYMADNLHPELNITYMLNMDMIGRLEDGNLQINGTGTSPAWMQTLELIDCPLRLNFSESGVGASDHTSFYYKDIPVLHFFTGTHADYHKPSDIAEKINAEGIVQVMNLMIELLKLSEPQKIEFSPTKNESTKAPKFSVTLGIMPNYMFKQGLKLDGVTAGKPAAQAGLETGDIIIKIGHFNISDIQTYMEALSNFKEGQETTVYYLRDGGQLQTTVKF